MRIIGITGTLGAGKGTIVDYLVKKRGYRHYSVRGFLIKEAERRGMEINRDTFVVVANDLRASHSPSYIIDQLYLEALENGTDAIIESIRTPGEVESLRRKDHFILVGIDADPEIRYGRIVDRASETDKISFETFIQNEQREMESTGPNHQNLRRCMQMADHIFTNNGTFGDLYLQIEDYFGREDI